MTALAALLARRIAVSGPMRLSDYMAECLLNPLHGYYATRDPLGAAGDFTTAPEISQMFGELIGLCLAQSWLDQGAPRAALAEAGPGRGTLMADIWRATRGVPGFHERVTLHLIEASPVLRAAQAARLAGAPATWHDSVDALPDAPLWFVANEFFDALPIRQFHRAGDGWREVVVGVQGERLAPGLTPPAPLADLAHRLADTRDGDIVETCPAARPVMQAIQQRIAAHGGAAVIVDYGGWHSLGDTFQAIEDHAFADPFANPGRADLTAHVDFEALALAAGGLSASALMPQGALLRALGIDARAQRLARGLGGAALEQHQAAYRRLTHAQEMGTLFKALALVPPGAPLPPGFAPATAKGSET
ncbi:MAG: SAM-dependent methyltransferase [Rhodobacter sp.]|uniref:class I SAM-dependent methyltransferase n=1 Tax=Pararhodobacter sp. TaxID=2127056 RepID=UPI002BF0CCE3|nr:SAM-dependent methyltransferase [Pararhodobacter sp.]MCC0072793.1 SAM-dependent methyltransferase [Rhodobacter sp.]HPD90899.1 SAM-dependent methyltransferase [Pararhodobacter sp.]